MADSVVSMDVRIAVAFFLQAAPGVSVTGFCAEQGISRETFYKFKRRFEAGGLEALVPLSRRPHRSPRVTDAVMRARIVDKREQLSRDGLDAGAVSIGYRLRREGLQSPSARTIHRILVGAGLVEPEPRKRPRSSFKRFAATAANGCWQMDGTDRALADGSMAKVLRVQDDCSRKIMASRAAVSENTVDAWACLEAAMTRHGRPAMLLSDRGAAFTQRRGRRGALGVFEARLRNLGILPMLASPGHPQTCGKKEREWQTLHRWLDARPPAPDLADLQVQLDAYDLIFNHDRPRQANHGRTPDEAYAAAPIACAADQPLAAPMTINKVKVRRDGVVNLGSSTRTSIGIQWAYSQVTVLREDPAVAIFHDDQLIRFLHLDPTRGYQLQPRH
jgi:transposase InsO family protein